MAKNKKGIIAGVTYDKWLRETRRKPAPIKEINKYSNQLIAFLDVLGIKELIEQHRNNNEHIAIDRIEEIRKIVEISTSIVRKSAKIDYLHISDSFVFVCEPKTVILLIELLSSIQARILSECKFLLRGAITIGDAIVREEGKFIIGPAYIQAYQLQENDAIYPRIIVDKSVVKEIKKNRHKINRYLLQDSDKEYFVDYINVYMQKLSLKKEEIKAILRRVDIFNHLRGSFNERYQNGEHGISQKYGWTIQYFRKLEVWEK